MIRVKFCYIHGDILDENRFCKTCVDSGKDRYPKYDLEQTLKERNDNKHPLDKWQSKWATPLYKQTDYIHSIYLCETCKYFNYHSLVWCCGCGQKLVNLHLYRREILEKYPDFREGY